jgi:hypothetical protein
MNKVKLEIFLASGFDKSFANQPLTVLGYTPSYVATNLPIISTILIPS